MTATFLSRFTPSMMTPEALEAVFVQREALAQRLVDLTRESALTPAKHYALLVGPRGIGKTHLISLVYHRICAMDDLLDHLLIAWLREEEWGVTSFLDLLLRIFRALLAEYGEPALAEQVEALYDLPPDLAERAAGRLLREFAAGRTLLLLVENLDDLFDGLGDLGQKRLRAYFQENPFCTILASAPSLFNGVSLQTSPFYGFFRIQHLSELAIEEAVQLLAKIASFDNDSELASFIYTPRGRARIRAVHHLASGNPRIYVILAQFLTRDSLDALVEPFMRTLDDLTPYYQARMAWVSLQQRKIVEFLCDFRHAVSVKEIAQRCFITQQTASSQLKELREKGYVQSHPIGRESYYELREPLMRMCFEVKKHRGEPIRLFVDFLRLWYSPSDLEQRLAALPPDREALASLDRAIELGDRSSHVLFNRAEALMALDRWNEGATVLDDALCRFAHSAEPEVGDTTALVANLLARLGDIAMWRPRIQMLIQLYDKHQTLAVLGQGLVRSIPVLCSALVSDAAARMWLQLWREAADECIELELPLRLLDAAVRFREARDARVLLELPFEERTLLDPLLGLYFDPRTQSLAFRHEAG